MCCLFACAANLPGPAAVRWRRVERLEQVGIQMDHGSVDGRSWKCMAAVRMWSCRSNEKSNSIARVAPRQLCAVGDVAATVLDVACLVSGHEYALISHVQYALVRGVPVRRTSNQSDFVLVQCLCLLRLLLLLVWRITLAGIRILCSV